jgi:hypothetical protein
MSETSLLDDLANKYQTDKGTKYPRNSTHGYAPIYENYLNKWRHEPIRLLEIGLSLVPNGVASVQMWLEYFTAANIYTLDIRDTTGYPIIGEHPRVGFFRGDQGNRTDIETMYESFGSQPFDFILEDGSHQHNHQMISLGSMFKYVKSGGYYILEDISRPGKPCCCERNDETYTTIINYMETGKLVSEHLLPEEIEYLESTIDHIDIHIDVQDAYAVAIITKK